MVRVFLVLGGDLREHRALNELKWQRVKGGWLGSDGPCPWEMIETRNHLSLYNQNPANSTILCTRTQHTTIATNFPPFLEVCGTLRPNRQFLESWMNGGGQGCSGLQLDFLKGVFRVPWGHVLRLSPNGRQAINCLRTAHEQMTLTRAVEELDRRIEEVIRKQVSGRNCGHALALSSGLDSMIVGTYLKKLSADTRAFTMDSTVCGTDERLGTRRSAELLGLPLSGFDIDDVPVLGPREHPYWGPQVHPGETHETDFLRFVSNHGFSKIFMGAGADQICYASKSSVLRNELLSASWCATALLRQGIGWRQLFSAEGPREQFTTLEWDLAVRHRQRIQRGSGVELIQPFLEPEIVDFVLALPSNYLASTKYDKIVLRELGRKVSPSFNSARLKYTHFGPSIRRRLSREIEPQTLTPRSWRKVAAQRWLREFYEK